jgi:hypothetical protein
MAPAEQPLVENAAPRRQARLPIGTREHFRWLGGIVKTLLVLNLIDAVLTLLWVRAGLAREANALMRDLVNQHAVAFVTVKLALVSIGSWFLWRHRNRAIAVVSIFVCFFAYYLILLYHVQYMSLLVRNSFGG